MMVNKRHNVVAEDYGGDDNDNFVRSPIIYQPIFEVFRHLVAQRNQTKICGQAPWGKNP